MSIQELPGASASDGGPRPANATPRLRAPGHDPRRLARLMQEAVRRCQLDLTGAIVLTEAASGADLYVVTPIIAALAGASVIALTRTSRHGTAAEVAAETTRVAGSARVAHAIEVVTACTPAMVAAADVITNSGHLRPLDAQLLGAAKPSAVIPLMYEAWEMRDADVDLGYCRERGIPVAGTNEQHPAVDVFSFLGIMGVKLLHDAAVAVYGSRVLLLCDNDFEPFITAGLRGSGALVDRAESVTAASGGPYDAILVALRPRATPVLGVDEARVIGSRWPGAVVAQYWGDVDRAACVEAGTPVWPLAAPDAGHMGVLPSAVGPEAVVRLQTGGLKVGEILFRARRRGASAAESLAVLADSGYGTLLPAGSGVSRSA